MKLTLIITTYNWPESLLLVLNSINKQSIMPDEVIIADDGSNNDTKNLINEFKNNSSLNVIHSWQKDIGFRAARSRNKAILKSSGDYIVLIDGDTVLHCDFIKDHISNAEPKNIVQGTRSLISKKQTNKALIEKKINFKFFSFGLKNRKNTIHSNFLSSIFSSRKNHMRGIKSCNMAFFKDDCIKVNGFNNEFEGWGREDSEFVVRMMNNGVRRKNVRFNAVQFHLWHNENLREALLKNDLILKEAINNQKTWCQNGIYSIEKNES
jgi:glycosyltransferase involved in cell wall biosynthesis